MTRPLIAVPAYHLAAGRVQKWTTGGYAAPEPYVDAVRRAGGRAVLLTSPDDDPAEALGSFDGLLLLGGGDLDPGRFGAAPGEQLYGVEPDREELEVALVREADRRAVPTLAICRGFQVVNVAWGGSLHQHLPDMPGLVPHGVPGGGDVAVHDVALTEGSMVREAMGVGLASCSSHHHQGVDRVGKGLAVSGRSEDGLVEALERPDGWLVAVQWHPEDTAGEDPAQQRLFDTLVARAKI